MKIAGEAPTGFKATKFGDKLEHAFNVACDESAATLGEPQSFRIRSSYEPYGLVKVTVEVDGAA